MYYQRTQGPWYWEATGMHVVSNGMHPVGTYEDQPSLANRRLRVAAPLGFTFTGTGGATSTVDFFVNAGAVTFTERPVVARDSFLSTPKAHRPVLADFQFRDSGGPEERHIRPSVLGTEYVRERAAGLYGRNLPGLEQFLDQVRTA
jgi:hypothetical protein